MRGLLCGSAATAVRHSLLGCLAVPAILVALGSATATAGGDLPYPPAAYAPPPAYYPPPVAYAVPIYVLPPVYGYAYPRFYGGHYGGYYGPRRYVHRSYYGWRGYGRGPYYRGRHGRRW